MPDLDALLLERRKTHGFFPDHAAVAQYLKSVIFNPHGHIERLTMIGDHDYSPVQREGLEMFAHKLGRIIAGNPHEPDHWRDLAGYAQLVADDLEREPVAIERPETDMSTLALEMRDQPLRQAGETFGSGEVTFGAPLAGNGK